MSEIDPDPVVVPRPSRAMHLSAGYLALVAAGGVVGTAAREAVALAVPDRGGFPVAVFAINLTGAFLLGLLLEVLLRAGAETRGRRVLRLLLGTGFCGGFTTYSALAEATAVLLADGRAAIGVGYALATLIGGAVTTTAGVLVGGIVHRRAR